MKTPSNGHPASASATGPGSSTAALIGRSTSPSPTRTKTWSVPPGRHPHLLTDVDANHLAAEWLCQPASGFGRSQGLADLIGNADERRAQAPTLALVLAACGAHVAKDTWREYLTRRTELRGSR